MALLFKIVQWLLGGILLLAAVLMASLYIRGAFRRRSHFYVRREIAPSDDRFLPAIQGLTGSLESTAEILGFYCAIDEIQQARLAAIASARRSILFETFMMTPGKRAEAFADAIAQRAIAGVEVRILVDDFGSRALGDRYWQRLQSAGARVVIFNPFDWRAPANYAGRTHRKLLIVDGDRALIGGAGISDLWDGTEKSDDTQPWLDIEVAIGGEAVRLLSAVFQAHWQGYRQLGSSDSTGIDMGLIATASGGLREPAAGGDRARTEARELAKMLITPGTKPTYRSSAIGALKLTAIGCAQKRVWLSSPYFLPNRSARELLIAAQKKGIDVRILTTSERSDKKPVYYASHEMYGPMLAAGIKIFEYQPSMLHAKMTIVDSAWVNMGSANFDYRSFLHNDELDITTDSPLLLRAVEQVFERGFAESKQVSQAQWQHRAWLKHRLLGNLVRLVQWQL